jgi:hypothetical protein
MRFRAQSGRSCNRARFDCNAGAILHNRGKRQRLTFVLTPLEVNCLPVVKVALAWMTQPARRKSVAAMVRRSWQMSRDAITTAKGMQVPKRNQDCLEAGTGGSCRDNMGKVRPWRLDKSEFVDG